MRAGAGRVAELRKQVRSVYADFSRLAAGKGKGKHVEQQRDHQEVIEADHQRQRLAEAAQHGARDVRAQVDVGLVEWRNAVAKMMPAK